MPRKAAVADDDDEAPLIAQDHFLTRQFHRQQALVEGDDVLRDGPLGVQPRVLDRPLDLSELHHQHLFGLRDGEQGGAGDDRQHDQRRETGDRGPAPGRWPRLAVSHPDPRPGRWPRW